MIIEIVVGLGIFAVGVVVGALVYRNNPDEGEELVQAYRDANERLNVELREALDELEAAKAKLTRKPKAK